MTTSEGTPIDLEKMRSISTRVGPRPVKRTTDEVGNTVTERWDGQDVHIAAPVIHKGTSLPELSG